MGNCCSNPSPAPSPSPRAGPIPQQQSRIVGGAPEFQAESHSVSPHRYDATPGPAFPIHPSEFNPSPTPAQSGGKRSRNLPGLDTVTSPSQLLPQISAYLSPDNPREEPPLSRFRASSHNMSSPIASHSTSTTAQSRRL